MFRTLALAGACAFLPASNCDDNLGQGSPSPVVFRISTARDSVQADAASDSPSVSSDGRFVAFASKAQNLALPRSAFKEIFIKDRFLDTLENLSKVSTVINPAQAADCTSPAVSGDGNRVAFQSKGHLIGVGPLHATSNIYLRDRTTGVLSQVIGAPWPDSDLAGATLSSDGMLLAFQSSATNLPIANPGGASQIYVADMSGTFPPPLTLVSRGTASAATFGNNQSFQARISTDGQFVTFASAATNLDPASPGPASILQVYVGTPTGAACQLVSRATGAGALGNGSSLWPTISGDGRFVAYTTFATNLTPGAPTTSIVVRDRGGSGTTLLAASDPFATYIAVLSLYLIDRCGVSDDGQLVVYRSSASQVQLVTVPGGAPQVLSLGLGGAVSNNNNSQFFFPDLSGNGQWAVWQSDADNLILGETNAATDIYGFGRIR